MIMSRKGKYTDMRFKILHYLVAKTDGQECLRQDIIKEYKFPESSTSNVINAMIHDGLLSQKRTFRSLSDFRIQYKIRLTLKGREEYERLVYPKGIFELPAFVQKYLHHKEPKVNSLFSLQKLFIERGLLHRQKNASIFGYPGSGKTLIAEIAMVNTIQNGGKALYCTPYKALDWQKYQDFKDSFKVFPETNVLITDGDNGVSSEQLKKADVIIGTYERVVGAIRGREKWIEDVSLVCVDEITHLAQDERGGTLDLLLTSLKLRNKPVRLITLSSLVGNAPEISSWLNAEPVIDNRPPSQIEIKESLVYKNDGELIMFSKDGSQKSVKTSIGAVDYIVTENLASNETTLIFVGSRDNAERYAEKLKQYQSYNKPLADKAQQFLQGMKEKTDLTKRLVELIGYDIAFHHAGLQRKARKFVESLLKDGLLRTIVATTTLSHGVDYSIDNVIIDLHEIENAHRHPLPTYEYINLKGRTGRYGKSKNANVYILADKEKADIVFNKYFLTSPEPIFPENTFDKENIAALILYEAEDGLDLKKIREELSQTFYAKHNRKQVIKLGKIVQDMISFGFLQRKGMEYKITKLGSKVNLSGLMPYDAAQVLGLTARSSIEDIVELASSIDLAKRVSKRGTEKDAVVVLNMWIEGRSIDDIKSKIESDYDDQDIIDLAHYTALSLKKMLVLLKSKRIKQILNRLERRNNSSR